MNIEAASLDLSNQDIVLKLLHFVFDLIRLQKFCFYLQL